MRRLVAILLLALLAGCAVTPTAPKADERDPALMKNPPKGKFITPY